MQEEEKAKRLWHLFYLMGKMRAHANAKEEVRMRDVMTLCSIALLIEKDIRHLIKMSDISAYFLITPAAVSQLVRDYERKGWLRRVVSQQDRRSVYVEITNAGKQLLEEQEKDAMHDIIAFLHYLGEEDSDALIRILEKATDYGPIMKQRSKGKEAIK